MKPKPNILLITTDQQRFDTIHAAGNPHIRTPHLDWLVDNGIRFSRCYSDAPLCIPTRATIMNGKHGYRSGLTYNTEKVKPINAETSLPGVLTKAGYQTRAQGKMHFKPKRSNYGFEHMELLEDYYRYMARHPEKGTPANTGLGQNEMAPGISTVDETNSLTHWIVDRSVDFIETRDDSRPFFLWASFSKPHPPYDPCLSYWLMYQNATVPEPVYGDWSEDASSIPTGWKKDTLVLNNCDRFSPELIRDARRAYYACITQVDYNLGCLIARLREMDLLDNTFIIFTSDHGDLLGDHHLGAKSRFLEGSAHVPMLVRPPASMMPAEMKGTTCDSFAIPADVYRTCLAAAGADVQVGEECDGLDLMAVARGEQARSHFFGQCEEYYAVHDGQYKYHYCYHGGEELLFDMETDPMEQNNLANDESMAAKKAELRQALIDEMKRVNDEWLEHGDLPVRPTPTEQELRGQWPGFHSLAVPNDILH